MKLLRKLNNNKKYSLRSKNNITERSVYVLSVFNNQSISSFILTAINLINQLNDPLIMNAPITFKRTMNEARPNLIRVIATQKTSKEPFLSPSSSSSAAADEQIVATLVSWKQENENAMFVSSLEVKREFRRKGIATKILNACFVIAKERRCSKVRLSVNVWNTKGIKLYEKYGFARENERSIFEHMKEPLQIKMVMDVR